MREIKFRGKRIDNGDWVYGDLIITRNKVSYDPTIVYFEENLLPESPAINKETAGQWTGLKDKNGVDIYEGDIVKADGEYGDILTGEIYYRNGCFMLREHTLKQIYNEEVVGNIYENPDIL